MTVHCNDRAAAPAVVMHGAAGMMHGTADVMPAGAPATPATPAAGKIMVDAAAILAGSYQRNAPVLPLHRDVLARPNTFNPSARTIECVAATATPVRRVDERGEWLEILDPSGCDLAALRGASVLDGHDQWSGTNAIIGVVEDAWREGESIIARLRFSEREEIAGVVRDIGSGVIRNVSVGYSVSEWREGEQNGVRTRTAVKWRAGEISLVAVGADPNAKTRGAGVPGGGTGAPGDGGLHNRAAVNREIRALGARAGASADLVNDLTDRGATLEEARGAIFDNLLSRGALNVRPTAQTTLDDPAVFVRAAGEALYARTRPSYSPSAEARQFMAMPVAEIARECLRRSGVSTTGLWGHELITRALTGMHTTSDFPQIFGDMVGRTLRDAYQAAPSGIRQLAREATAPDFRTRMRVMLDTSGFMLERVNEHGEFKQGTLAEAKESYKVDTYGRTFNITRQALINDDLGAFTDLARKLGAGAAAFEAQFLVNLLESNNTAGPVMGDGINLFNVDAHRNVFAITGGGDAPLAERADEVLNMARLLLRRQTGPGGGLITLQPRWLLVPAELELWAEKLLATITPTRIPDANPFMGSLRLVVEPRLSSPSNFFVVAEPSELEYAYLRGFAGPQTETQVGFDIDGISVRVRLDYGAGFLDHRSWVLAHWNPAPSGATPVPAPAPAG